MTGRPRSGWSSLYDAAELEDELPEAKESLIRSMLGTVGSLARPSSDLLDLKIADSALRELADAFTVFGPYRSIPKLTMFGSARTEPHDPVYVLARDLAGRLAADGWMIVTGAGPGIMQAGSEGAGRERSFGVNIKLPLEQSPNPVIAEDSKLVEMRYFFTRKLIMVKESDAYAVLPGGFGTLDEAFELLTLLQTGKSQPAPLVLVETASGGYWHRFGEFVEREVIGAGYAWAEDASLFTVADSAEEAVAAIEGFYRCYHSIRLVGELLVMRLSIAPSDAELAEINRRFSDIVISGDIHRIGPLPPEQRSGDHLELDRIALRFNRIHYGRLRQLIDALNECTGA